MPAWNLENFRIQFSKQIRQTFLILFFEISGVIRERYPPQVPVCPARVDHLFFVTKNNGDPTFTGYPLFYCRPCPTDAIITIFQITVMSAHAAVREFLRFQLSMCLPKKDETVCASLYSLSPGYCPSPVANSTSPSTSP